MHQHWKNSSNKQTPLSTTHQLHISLLPPAHHHLSHHQYYSTGPLSFSNTPPSLPVLHQTPTTRQLAVEAQPPQYPIKSRLPCHLSSPSIHLRTSYSPCQTFQSSTNTLTCPVCGRRSRDSTSPTQISFGPPGTLTSCTWQIWPRVDRTV